jgi:signal transduction histidine kinase
VAQVSRIVLAMKEFSHPSSKERVPVDLNAIIERATIVCRAEWKHAADLDLQLNPDLPAMLGFEGELNQVILNMAVNAAHAIADKGAGQGLITIRTAAIPGGVELCVTDTGTGIPEALRRRIFDPFFTTKGVGKGTGQGLAICQDIVVNKHGGTIDIETVPGEGTSFIMRFPDSTADGTAQQLEQAEAV